MEQYVRPVHFKQGLKKILLAAQRAMERPLLVKDCEDIIGITGVQSLWKG